MTRLTRALEARDNVYWLARAVLGKAAKGPAKVKDSILTDEGFLTAALKTARLLVRETSAAVGSKGFRDALKASADIDWHGAKPRERETAIKELENLIKGLPSQFAPGVKLVLNERGKAIADETHQATGLAYPRFVVDPVFALKNETALKALEDTQSLFFKDEYERRGDQFKTKVRDTIATGLEAGKGRQEIAEDLSRELRTTAIAEDYWETVAAVQVARVRSFSQAVTYAENGIEAFEVLAVMDERTTEVCQMMDGKILALEPAMDSFDRIEDSYDLDEVKGVAPMMFRRGKDILLEGSNAKVGHVLPSGKTEATMSEGSLQMSGVHMPPYHYRCRTTVVPVMNDLDPIPMPVAPKPGDPEPAAATPPAPPPGKPPKKPRGKQPPDRLKDPIAATLDPKAKQAALLGQIKNGIGLVPGSMPDKWATNFWGVPPGQAEKVSYALSKKISKEFHKIGEEILAKDTPSVSAWNQALIANHAAVSSGAMTGWTAEDSALRKASLDAKWKAIEALQARAGKIGGEAIPAAEREARRKAFIADVQSKSVGGFWDEPTKKFYPFPVGDKRRDVDEIKKKDPLTGKPTGKAQMETWAGEFFDAWGPLAEASLRRNDHLIMSDDGRAHNNQAHRYFAFDSHGSTFAHEFGHSLENHVTTPLAEFDEDNKWSNSAASYWRGRIETKDKKKPEKLSKITGNSGFKDEEISKKDQWGDAYMGKLYGQWDMTEVVAMLSEGYSKNVTRWVDQFDQDPDMLLEFIGWQKSTIDGEVTRQMRIAAAKQAAYDAAVAAAKKPPAKGAP